MADLISEAQEIIIKSPYDISDEEDETTITLPPTIPSVVVIGVFVITQQLKKQQIEEESIVDHFL